MESPGQVKVKLRQKRLDAPDFPLCNQTFNILESLADCRERIIKLIKFPFQFWDDSLPGRVVVDMEPLCKIIDVDGGVIHIIEVEECDASQNIPSVGAGLISSQSSVPSHSDGGILMSEEEVQPNAQPPHVWGIFESQLMQAKMKSVWVEEVQKLQAQCKVEGKADHKWTAKTFDEGGEVQGHLKCLECKEQYGHADKAQDKIVVRNLFGNFRRSHLHCSTHIRHYAKQRNLSKPPKNGHSSDTVSEVAFDHEGAIRVGLEIVQESNEDIGGAPVFVVEPPLVLLVSGAVPTEYKNKSFMFYVNCTVCSKLHTVMCPRKKNLSYNLKVHLESNDHNKALRGEQEKLALEVRTGKRGRPRKPDVRDQYPSQNSLTKWLRNDQSRSSSSQPSNSGRGALENDPVEVDIGLSLLCWGVWREKVKYAGVGFHCKALLQDSLISQNWIPEFNTRQRVYHPQLDSIVSVEGCFRSTECERLSVKGGGFEDLTCTPCNSIITAHDFRNRVLREAGSVIPRGDRDTSTGIRLGYLTIPEIASHMKRVTLVAREQRWKLARQGQRIASLSTRKLRLEELLGKSADRKDLRQFLRNIVHGHLSGAFGGKEGLWSFLKDAAHNLERKAQGVRYSASTKAIAQAMLQFGGRQVAQCFAGNLGAPSLKTLKRGRALLVPFRGGLRKETFQEVGRILAAAKLSLGIEGDVPVMFAEDETRIKERPRWEAKYDTLIGFCGPSENHSCSFGLEVGVGEGEVGYDRILSTFQHYTKACYARMVIVNPLHEKLPKLALCAIPTCNKFTAEWVRQHWDELKRYWDLYCRAGVGPLLGHASDGDARRRKLMLIDYRGGRGGPRYSVGWKGWQYSVGILPNGDLYGFGDQDQPHNGKKLINPLDRVSSNLILGDQRGSLSYVTSVYSHYPIHEHGLNWDDVNRTDRQNWAGPQRIASRKVQDCLQNLFERRDIHHDRTLGTRIYLEICADYIDVFFSVKHDLKTRLILAAKVSFFLRLWRLWLQYGNHSASGNVAKPSQKDMISLQAFHDVNMSCHFIVLLVCAFRDKFPYLAVPFHLLGSDCCEIFFSKVGGMSGHERSYDFGSLLDSAVGLNRLASLEYGPEGLKVGRSHKKQDHVWKKLHPLLEGEVAPDLLDYSLVQTNELVVVALKEGLQAAKSLLTTLGMSPRSTLPVVQRRWWTCPWDVEIETWPDTVSVLAEVGTIDDEEDSQEHDSQNPVPQPQPINQPQPDLESVDSWARTESERERIHGRGSLMPTACETASSRTLRSCMPVGRRRTSMAILRSMESRESGREREDDTQASETSSSVEEENQRETATLGHEVRHAIGSIIADHMDNSTPTTKTVVNYVVFDNRTIYKSTLVSELVGNPHLSKDRLTRMKEKLYYSTGKKRSLEDDPNARPAFLGTDCAIAFEEDDPTEQGPSTRAKQRQSKKGKGKSAPIQQRRQEKVFFLGRITEMRQKHGKQWGKTRQPIDLSDRPKCLVGQVGPICQFQFDWYKKVRGSRNLFTFDCTDHQWIDLDAVICSVTLHVHASTSADMVFKLDELDLTVVEDYLKTMS